MTKRLLAIALAVIAIALAPHAPIVAQQPTANTEVYLARLSHDTLPMTGGELLNISNSPGYDNQPSFTADGAAVLFTSNRDGKQTDIYRYDIATKALTQLTHTTESEYSPLVTPDGKGFSVIRVEADGTQRLWRFDMDGSNPRLVLENIKPVGYHVWIDSTHLALYVLGANHEPATLQLADTTTGKAEVVDTNIGRSLLKRPGGSMISFVSQRATPWTVKEFDPATRAITDIAPALDGSEDCAWDPVGGQLLMAKDAKIFVWAASAKGWAEAGDFASAGIGKITRLAVSPSRSGFNLALVAEPVKK